MNFWRWYFRRLKNANRLLLVLIALGLIFSDKGLRVEWRLLRTAPLLWESFFIGFVLLIFGTNFVFEFMTYKLNTIGLAERPTMRVGLVREAIGSLQWQFQMQKIVPLEYKQTFGSDLIYRLWQSRLLVFPFWFIAFMAVAFMTT